MCAGMFKSGKMPRRLAPWVPKCPKMRDFFGALLVEFWSAVTLKPTLHTQKPAKLVTL